MALSDLRHSLPFWRARAVSGAVAVAIALLAWFGVRLILPEQAAQPAAPPPSVAAAQPAPAPEAAPPPAPTLEPDAPVQPKVLVATRPLEAGIMLVSGIVEWREWRDEVDLELFILDGIVSLEAILGSVTRRAFAAGAPISWDGIIVPGGPGFIGAVLGPGMRAVTISVDPATTSANIIYPGDHVDVILVAAADAAGGELAAHAIVEDVRVLAVGSTTLTLDRFPARAGLLEGLGEVGQNGVGAMAGLPRSDSYTLEVGPRDARRIALAATSGNIILTTRSIAPPSFLDYDGFDLPVRWDEVMVPEPLPEEDFGEAELPGVRVIRVRETGIESETVLLGMPGGSDDPAELELGAPGAALGGET